MDQQDLHDQLDPAQKGGDRTARRAARSRRSGSYRTTAALVGVAGLLALSACGGQGGQAEAPEGGGAAPENGAAAPEEGGAEGEATDEAAGGASPTDTMEGSPTEGEETAEPAFTADLQDPEGTSVGTAEFREAEEGAMEVHAEVMDMEPGFYGFHVHEIGECEPDSAAPDDPENTGDFMSAGGHIGVDETDHPEHAGDLPTLLVQESGEGVLTFHTDRLAPEHFEDEDGAALMVHGTEDNFANIPERYAPEGPDQDTLDTGDAGDRLACGVVEAAG